MGLHLGWCNGIGLWGEESSKARTGGTLYKSLLIYILGPPAPPLSLGSLTASISPSLLAHLSLSNLPHPYSSCGNTMAFDNNNNGAAANNAVETPQHGVSSPRPHPTIMGLTGTGGRSVQRPVRHRELRRHRCRDATRSGREAATGTRASTRRGGEARLPVCTPAVRRGGGGADRATPMQRMGRPRQGPAVDEAARQEELIVMTAAAVGAAATACACCCCFGRGIRVAFEAWRDLVRCAGCWLSVRVRWR